ncbi:hypothetical protein BBP40_010243 [Aspergillus hancockii]|nr:hypothetical protein BBP40_010243 [Aspergillus hancockii]
MAVEAYNKCFCLHLEHGWPMQHSPISEMEFADDFPELRERCGMFLQPQTLDNLGNAICTSSAPTPQGSATRFFPQQQSSCKGVINPVVLDMDWQQNFKATTDEEPRIGRAMMDLNCDVPLLRHQPEKKLGQESLGNQRGLAPKKACNQMAYKTQKTVHNRNEKRYRASLDAKFGQLEDIIRTCMATGYLDSIDGKQKSRKPSRKALILQNAYNCIAILKANLEHIQKEMDVRRTSA